MITTDQVEDKLYGNGSTTVFSTVVFGRQASQFLVYLGTELLNGELQSFPADYTISNLDNVTYQGVTVTFAVPPATGTVIRVVRRTSPLQTLNITESRAYDPEGLEVALDNLTMALQETIDINRKSVTVREPTPTFTPVEGAVIIYTADGFASGPSVATIEGATSSAGAAASSAAAAAQSAAEALSKEQTMLVSTGPWVAPFAYTVGDLVYFIEGQYECIADHTSNVFATDLASGKWRIFVLRGTAGVGTGNMNNEDNLSGLTDKALAFATLGGKAVGKVDLVTFALLDPAIVVLDNEVLALNKSNSKIPTAKAVTDYVDSKLTPDAPLHEYVVSGTVTSIPLINLGEWDEVELVGQLTHSADVNIQISNDNGVTWRTANYDIRVINGLADSYFTNGCQLLRAPAAQTTNFVARISNMAAPAKSTLFSARSKGQSGGQTRFSDGRYVPLERANAIRIVGGNFTAGYVDVRGIRREYIPLPPVPENDVLPSHSGTAKRFSTITVDPGSWRGDVGFFYRHYIAGEEQIGEVGETIIPQSVGALVSQVRAVDIDGDFSEWESTAPLTITYEPPANSVLPAIAGTLTPGSTLSGVNFAFTGSGTYTYQHRWELAGALVVTTPTYTPGNADTGKPIRYGIQATDELGQTSGYAYSEPVQVEFSGLVYTVQPTFSAGPFEQGDTIDINIGTAPLAFPAHTTAIPPREFSLGGVDKISELTVLNDTTFRWVSTGEPAGAVVFQGVASNSGESVLSNRITVALSEAVITAPGVVADAGWSVVNQGDGGKLTFTVLTAPTAGGSAITDYEIEKDASGVYVSLGVFEINKPSTLTIGTNGVSGAYKIRARNSSGPGALSAVAKNATPSDTKAPEIIELVYDTPTNAITVRTSEAAEKKYLFNYSGTPLTNAAIEAAVAAMTPDAYGTIAIGVTEVTPVMTGVTPGIVYLHMTAEDAAGNPTPFGSVIEGEWLGQSDIQAPIISLPTGAANGADASTGGFTTDEGNGTGFVIVGTSNTPATATQISEGKTAAGVAAERSASQSVTVAGVQSIPVSGLAPSTLYYRQYAQRDLAGNLSNAVVSAGFTTGALGVGVALVTATLMASTSASGFTYTSTTDHVVSAQANRVVELVVFGLSDVAGPPAISEFLFGGVAGTVVLAPTGPASSRAWMARYLFVNPSAGAKGATITLTTNQRGIIIYASEYKNVHQTLPVDASGFTVMGSSFVTSASFTTTTVRAGNLITSGLDIDSGNLVAEVAIAGDGVLIDKQQTGALASSDLTMAIGYEAAPSIGVEGHAYNWTTAKRAILGWTELRVA